jgi:hypothetical protein
MRDKLTVKNAILNAKRVRMEINRFVCHATWQILEKIILNAIV